MFKKSFRAANRSCPVGGSPRGNDIKKKIPLLCTFIGGQAVAASSFYLVVPLNKRTDTQAPPPVDPGPSVTDPLINPLSLAFAPVQVGDAAPARHFSITNTGELPLEVTGFRLEGNSPYSLMAPCLTLESEQSCDGYVYLDTTNAGSFVDRLIVEHTGPAGVSPLALSADVRLPAGELPAQANFGPVSVGSAKDLQVELKNTGVGRLAITSPGTLSVTGEGFSFVESSCPASLPVDGRCNITVRMTGKQPAEQLGQLSITTSAGALAAELRGIGQQSDLAFSSGPVASFNKVNVGESATSAVVTLKNSGNATANDLVLASTSDAYQIVDSSCATSLAAGASCTFKVKFEPQTAGAKPGELIVSSNGEVGATNPLIGSGGSSALLLAPSDVSKSAVVGTISTSNKPSPDAGKYRNSELTLKTEQNPFKANTENEAFDIVDEVVHDTHTQEGIELLKEPYQVERLGVRGLEKNSAPCGRKCLPR